MKIIIAGSRTYNDYSRLSEFCDQVISSMPETKITIVSGCAKGADMLGERYASERGYEVIKYPADWDKYGKSAGFLRNEEMAKVGHILIAFWDGQSKGTEHMINLGKKHNLKIEICSTQHK